MTGERRLQFSSGSRFVSLFEQRHRQMIAESCIIRILPNEVAENLGCAVVHAPLQIDPTDGIVEARFTRTFLDSPLRKLESFVEVSPCFGKQEREIVQRGEIVWV